MQGSKLGNKIAREFHKEATKHGFQLVRKGKHLVYEHPQAQERLTVSASPSDHRAVKNNVARMKRILRDDMRRAA